jgi:isopentenyl diphosphate isomerase/L-lactate dehydrogenase-like FMN-dependent dehydrogenase
MQRVMTMTGVGSIKEITGSILIAD